MENTLHKSTSVADHSERFAFSVPFSVFEKADAEDGKKRRIGGIISTELRDTDDEILLQDGLDFAPFLSRGWFNDNHSSSQTDILGYPELVKKVDPGELLPDGSIAEHRGTWAEGYLLEGYRKADDIWSLAQALTKTQGARRLGFSVEGSILRRAESDRRIVSKAVVENVAITHCPKNRGTLLSTLAKSLKSPGVVPVNLSTQAQSLSRSQAILFVLDRLPAATPEQAATIVDMIARGVL